MWFVQSTWETVILLCEVWFQCKIEPKLFEELVWKVKIRFTFKEFMLHLNLELPLSPDCVCRVSHSDNNRRNKSHIPQQSRSNFILNPLQFYLFGIAHTKKKFDFTEFMSNSFPIKAHKKPIENNWMVF